MTNVSQTGDINNSEVNISQGKVVIDGVEYVRADSIETTEQSRIIQLSEEVSEERGRRIVLEVMLVVAVSLLVVVIFVTR